MKKSIFFIFFVIFLAIGTSITQAIDIQCTVDAPCCCKNAEGQSQCYGSGYCCGEGYWQPTPCNNSRCIHSNPTVTITPSSQTECPGTSVSYTITVKNNDQNCGDETFDLSKSCPSGFTCTLSKSSLSISSGSSASATITVSSSSTTSDGTYTFSVTATNSNDNSYHSTGSADYVVKSSCTDTDGGKDYTTKGTVTDCSGSYTDKCYSDTVLTEYYCYNGKHAYTYYDCTQLGPGYICSDGACTKNECSKDSDCDDGNPCTTDKCVNPGTTKAHCQHTNVADGTSCGSPHASGNYCYYNFVCENGVCIHSTDTLTSSDYYYSSGDTCYYNCYYECTSTGWEKIGCNEDVTKVCDQSVCTNSGWDNSACQGTWISVYPRYISPGNNVTITIHWSSSSYDKTHDIQLNLYIDNKPWDGDNCVFSGKWIKSMGYGGGSNSNFNSWSVSSCSKKLNDWYWPINEGWCKDENMGYYYHVQDGWPMKIKPKTGEGIMVFVCRIPANLGPGAHTITVVPTIKSKPVKLSPVTTQIYLVPENKTPLKDLFLSIIKFFKSAFR